MANQNRAPERRVPGRTSGWPGGMIAIALIVLVLLIIWIVRQPRTAANPNGPANQQSQQVAFSNLTTQPGQGTFNITGQATNKTDKPISEMRVQVGFRNLTGNTLEKTDAEVKNADGSDLASNPIGPNQSKPVTIVLTHAPAGWDERTPDISVTSVNEGAGSSATNESGSAGSQPMNGTSTGASNVANPPNQKTPRTAGRGEQPGSTQRSNGQQGSRDR